MVRPKLIYVFRRPVTKLLKEVATGQVPEDIFYGLTRMYKDFDVVVTDKFFRYRLLLGAQQLLNKVILQFLGIGFSLFPTVVLLPELRRADLIFATVDTYGLPIALFKKMGLVRSPLILNTIGLYDGLVRKQNKLAISFCHKVLSCVDGFVSGGSFQECEKLSRLLQIPLNKFVFIPFGIDTHFFHPKPTPDANYILAIGADPSRDWYLYAKVARRFPKERFLIVTYKGLVKVSMPNNVSFLYNVSYIKLRQLIWQSKCVVLLSRINHYFAGQSTAFRAMSCGKSVIFTKNPGVEEYQFKDGRHCLFVPANDTKINASSGFRQILDRHARKIIETEYNLTHYSQALNRLFIRCLNKS